MDNIFQKNENNQDKLFEYCPDAINRFLVDLLDMIPLYL